MHSYTVGYRFWLARLDPYSNEPCAGRMYQNRDDGALRSNHVDPCTNERPAVRPRNAPDRASGLSKPLPCIRIGMISFAIIRS
jgi:hypothetical protein